MATTSEGQATNGYVGHSVKLERRQRREEVTTYVCETGSAIEETPKAERLRASGSGGESMRTCSASTCYSSGQ